MKTDIYKYVHSPPSADSEGFLSVSSESMCKKYCFIPLFHTGPESHDSPRIDKYLDLWA